MRLRAVMLTLMLASPALAQDGTMTLWTRETLHSSKLNEDRSIYVATPNGYARQATKRYPILVILDADDLPQFNLAIANVAFLANRGTIPPLIVVGIPNGKDRTHDMTPPARENTAKDFPTAGGSAAFEDFIIDEVLPLVRSKYRALPSAILAGHSFGGLVALEVATRRPDAFNGIIAMSPSLWWNEASLVGTYYDALAKVSKRERVFVTSGGLEGDIDRPTVRLSQRMDSLKPTTIAFGHSRYPDDTHGLTPAPSLVDGLRFIFEPIAVARLPIAALNPSSDSADVVRAVIESKRLYADGARTFGLDERLPEPQLNQLGYGAMRMLKKPGLAIWILRQNVDLYPQSANVYDSLGDGLLAAGDTTAAAVEYRRGIEVGTRNHDPVIGETMLKLDALEASRAKAKAP